jgi:predicted RNA polymerase sigma factor
VIDLNRAVAYSMAFGPEAGLQLIDEIADAATLRNHAPLPAARGDFLFRAGRRPRLAANLRLRPD